VKTFSRSLQKKKKERKKEENPVSSPFFNEKEKPDRLLELG
jgi:hypothetical protein